MIPIRHPDAHQISVADMRRESRLHQWGMSSVEVDGSEPFIKSFIRGLAMKCQRNWVYIVEGLVCVLTLSYAAAYVHGATFGTHGFTFLILISLYFLTLATAMTNVLLGNVSRVAFRALVRKKDNIMIFIVVIGFIVISTITFVRGDFGKVGILNSLALASLILFSMLSLDAYKVRSYAFKCYVAFIVISIQLFNIVMSVNENIGRDDAIVLVELPNGYALYYFDVYMSLAFNLLSLTMTQCLKSCFDRQNVVHYFINDHVIRKTHTTSKRQLTESNLHLYKMELKNRIKQITTAKKKKKAYMKKVREKRGKSSSENQETKEHKIRQSASLDEIIAKAMNREDITLDALKGTKMSPRDLKRLRNNRKASDKSDICLDEGDNLDMFVNNIFRFDARNVISEIRHKGRGSGKVKTTLKFRKAQFWSRCICALIVSGHSLSFVFTRTFRYSGKDASIMLYLIIGNNTLLAFAFFRFFYKNFSMTVLVFLCKQFYFWLIELSLLAIFLMDTFVDVETINQLEADGAHSLTLRRLLNFYVFMITTALIFVVDCANYASRKFIYFYSFVVSGAMGFAVYEVYLGQANLGETWGPSVNLRRTKQWLYITVFTHFVEGVIHILKDKKEERFAFIKSGRYRKELVQGRTKRKRQLKSVDVGNLFRRRYESNMTASPEHKIQQNIMKRHKTILQSSARSVNSKVNPARSRVFFPSLTIETSLSASDSRRRSSLDSVSSIIKRPHTPGKKACETCGCIRGSSTAVWCGCGRSWVFQHHEPEILYGCNKRSLIEKLDTIFCRPGSVDPKHIEMVSVLIDMLPGEEEDNTESSQSSEECSAVEEGGNVYGKDVESGVACAADKDETNENESFPYEDPKEVPPWLAAANGILSESIRGGEEEKTSSVIDISLI